MRFKLQLITFSLLTFFFGILFTKNAFAANYTLSGSVKDNGGTAIVGATVSVNDANSDSTTSDSLGNYSFSIPQGTYNVQVTPPSGSNFSPAVALSQTVSANTVLNFVLVNAGSPVTLSGHVYDYLGNPVANQIVNLYLNGSQFRSTTDSSGSYSISVATGTYELEIFPNNPRTFPTNIPQDYFLDVSQFSLTQSTVADFTIPAKKVTVHVQDASNNPITNIKINTLPLGTNMSNSLSIGAGISNASGQNSYGVGGDPAPTTDTSGNVTMWLFPNDPNVRTYSIVATPPSGSNYGSVTLSNLTFTGDTNETITLPQSVTLSGHVYDYLGNPVSNQIVDLYLNGAQVRATTDSFGSYSMSVTSGTYELEIFPSSENVPTTNIPSNYFLDVSQYSITQNTVADFTIPAKKISVHVQDAFGNAIGNIRITTLPSGTNVNNALSIGAGITNAAGASSYDSSGFAPTTDSSGNAAMWLFPNDPNVKTYSIVATPPSGSIFGSKTISNLTFTNDTSVTVTLPQSITLSGHVYDYLGNPVANQTVDLYINGSQFRSTTDSSGSYSLSVSTGTYELEIFPNDTRSFPTNIPQDYFLDSPQYILTQNTVANFTIPVKKVTVHVQDLSNNPLSNIKINTLPLGTVMSSTLSIGAGISNASGQNSYGVGGDPAPTTDSSGNVIMWLFPNDPNIRTYSIVATPQSGSIYAPFTLNNVTVVNDQTEIVSLQYNHAAPTTNATLSPVADSQGNYPNPTTVTLSATAASGYTIANTYYTIDGGSQQTYSSSFTVSGEGSHTITYWSVDNLGVLESPNSKTFTIRTNQPPVISPISNVTINEGDTYSANGSFNDSDSSSWTATVDYGDGSGIQSLTLSGMNFFLSHPYEVPGVYTLTIKVTDNQGATGTANATITVGNVAPFVGGIDAPTSPVEPGDTVNILANFTDPGTTDSFTSTINWGDGSSSSCPTNSPNCTLTNSNGSGSVSGTHSYSTPGTYTITVTVTDSSGTTGTSTFPIVVNAPPTANAGGSYTVNEGSDVTLNGTGTDPDGDTLTYAWDLSGGTNFTTLGQSVPFPGVDGPATKTVTLQVCDTFQACATSSATVTVNNVNPSVQAISTSPSQPQETQALTATAAFTDPGTQDTHTASWNWGDGNSSTGTVTESNGSGSVTDNHTYATYGTYTITLTVTDKDGGVGTQTKQIFVNAPPVANAGGPYTMNEGDTIILQGSATDPDNDTLTYSWDLDNSGTYGLTGQTALFSAPDGPATKTVDLKVCDNNGGCNVSPATVTVNNVAPTVSSVTFSPTYIQQSGSVNLTADFTDPGILDTHTASIDWGDNSTPTTGTVTESNGSGTVSGTHTYPTHGTYTVTVIVTDKDGGVGSKTASLFVNAPPVANAGGPYSIAEGGSMPLQGNGADSDGDNLNYSWDLTGGTNFSTPGQTPIFQAGNLDGPTTQTVSLQVCDNHAACSTSQATVHIFPVAPVLGAITAPTDPQIVNSTVSPSVTFTDSGPADTHTAVWDYGDGTTGSGTVNESTQTVTGSHTYTQAGVYTLQVTLTDDDNQTATQLFQYVVIYDPSAGFVTGSGTINSPFGAEPVLPQTTGTATFGISAKYTNNNTVPTGTTMYNFPNGGFEFESTSYDWLTVNGSNAFLHGHGTINGGGSYTFLVSVVDGSPDTFRIKITDNANNVIYDNQMGAADNTSPTEAISNGQIKIH